MNDSILVALVIFNTIWSLVAMTKFIRRHFSIHLDRTFWKDRPYALSLWWKLNEYSSRSLVTIKWRNKDEIDRKDWDAMNNEKRRAIGDV